MSENFVSQAGRDIGLIAGRTIHGRQAPPAVNRSQRATAPSVETPQLPFERDQKRFSIRRPQVPLRVGGLETQPAPPRKNPHDGQYAFRFSDATWGHTGAGSEDHYASKYEIEDIIERFDQRAETIIAEDGFEESQTLQQLSDELLEALLSVFRGEDTVKCQIIERARNCYAEAFKMLQDDGIQCRDHIGKLEGDLRTGQANLGKVIEDSQDRLKEAQASCDREIEKIRKEMEAKKEEYDSSMKQFLAEKAEVDEHVAALHRVFLDFQNDSVYTTLQELKDKLKNYKKKLRHKDQEMGKMNGQLMKLQKTIQEADKNKKDLQQANDDLRRQLQMAKVAANKLERRIDILQNQGDWDPQAEEEETKDKQKELLNELPAQPLISADNVQDSAQKKVRSRARYNNASDATPYFNTMQKMSLAMDRITDVITRTTANVMLPPQTADDADKTMLSGNTGLMIKALLGKSEDLVQLTACLDGLELAGGKGEDDGHAKMPRFLQYIKSHNLAVSNKNAELMVPTVTLVSVRNIFNAKYISDSINERMGRPIARFPEFVVGYFKKEGEDMFTALARTARLWRTVVNSKLAELQLFRQFLLEKLTVDELSFFVEARQALIGMRQVKDDDPHIVTIPYTKCEEFLTSVLGAFSPILGAVSAEAAKHVVNGSIDYAAFLTVLTTYYQNERRRRRNAVRAMFQSKTVLKGEAGIDFEGFVSMVESLGFPGSAEDVFALFRETMLNGNGVITLNGFITAMDNLSFHFYSINVPVSITKRLDVTKMTRQQLAKHWSRFGAWFGAFRQPTIGINPWFKSKLMTLVKRMDNMFKGNAAVPALYTEYRGLLDFFQLGLDAIARSQQEAMNRQKSERQLALLENLIDLLVTFITKDSSSEVAFAENI